MYGRQFDHTHPLVSQITRESLDYLKTQCKDELTKDKSGNPTYGLLVEKDFPRIWDTVIRSEQIRNPDGLFTNTFYHHHQILSLSPFKNAVRLVGKAAT